MNANRRLRSLGIGLLALAGSLAPGPGQDPVAPPRSAGKPDLAALALARAEAGVKAYDLAWLYYSENRIPSELVYRTSKRLLEAGRDASKDKAARVAVCQGHLDRMQKLGEKIGKIRQLGFGNSLDVLETEYYVKEAEFWRASAAAE